QEKEELQAALSKAGDDHTQSIEAATRVEERYATALSKAQEAAQAAACEANSLRAKVKTLQDRSEEQTSELSSAVEEALSRGSRATKAAEEGAHKELKSMREAVWRAEAGKKKALEEMASVKNKNQKDLQ
ncbi:unnamed protein product, partial [Laminaria digitata]